MSHPFGVAYSTRSGEEGFGGIYARDDDRPAFNRPTAEAHPSHPPPGTFYLFIYDGVLDFCLIITVILH